MKLLQNIPTKSFISVDIETVRIAQEYNGLSELYKEAWQYKNKQDGEVPEEMELSDIWKRTASLYAEFSRVCAVSFAFGSEDSGLFVKEIASEDEVKVLEDTSKFLKMVEKKNKKTVRDERKILVGHAAKYFDYPFLCKRFVINGMPIPSLLDTAHLKPWDNVNLDTNIDIWKMGGMGPGSSLQALCVALGIPISKVDLVGDEVGSAFFRGEIDKIGNYCTMDAIATLNVVRRIKGESIFNFSDAQHL